MYFELFLLIWTILVIVFVIFWIVQEGSHWQRHPVLGVFARIIQKSPGRAFGIFLLLTLLMIPSTMMILTGYWVDAINSGHPPTSTIPVVSTLLLLMLLLSGAIPVMWSSFRTWRQAVRSAAEVRVRSI